MKETTGPDCVVTLRADKFDLPALIDARNRLRTAGVSDVVIGSSWNDPELQSTGPVTVEVSPDGQLHTDRGDLPDDAAVALFLKEIVGERAVCLNRFNEAVPLPVRAAGAKTVLVLGID